jgi:hypothetical protein
VAAKRHLENNENWRLAKESLNIAIESAGNQGVAMLRNGS